LSIRQQRIQNRIRNQEIMRNLTRGLLAVAILVGIGGFMLFLYHKTCIWLIDVHVVQYGELEDRVSTTAIVIKEETMVKASARGRFENKVLEGERVRSGSVAGLFYPEGELKPVSLYVPLSGVISFKPDGWEEILDDFSVDNGDQNIFDYSPRQFNDGSFQYESGEPLFKIIDNLVPLKLVVSIEPLALNEPLAIGDKLQVRYKDQLLGTAVCESVWPGEDRQTAILGLSGFNETLLDQRKIEVDCILNSYSGLIIPKESLVKSQAEDAVYKVRKEKVELSAVEVLAICNGQAVVDGLEPGDTIITTPGLVSEGMSLR
jgi:putative membrane fusion protein